MKERQGPNRPIARSVNRPRKYRKKPKPPLDVLDAGDLMADSPGRQSSGWYGVLLDLREAAEDGGIPAPFAALGAIRCVMDGLLHANQLLSPARELALPTGVCLAAYARPPSPGETETDPFAGRKADDLVPIPLWAAVHLATVHVQVTAALAAGSEIDQRQHAKSVDLNKLFGFAGHKKRGRGLLHLTVTRMRERQMATSVWHLIHQPDPPSLTRAVASVALAFCRGSGVVHAAWQKHRHWVEDRMTATGTARS